MGWKRTLAIAGVVGLGCLNQPAQGQIIQDGTAGTSVACTATTCTISNGTRSASGTSLFHSFQQFSVGSGLTADFANPAGVANIFARVTGSLPSTINGRIQWNRPASLFLINPNGVLLGTGATLNTGTGRGGSFIATSASSIRFDNGSEFSATNPAAPPLTVNVPIGLQFGNNPAAVNATNLTSGLVVPDATATTAGYTLALVGGPVSVQNSILRARGGRIELGAVGANSLVGLVPDPQGWAFNYAGVTGFQDLQIGQGSVVSGAGTGIRGGDIQVVGRQVTFSDVSSIVSVNRSNATGGNIAIRADQFNLTGGAQVRVQTESAGRAGELTVTANQVRLSGVQFDPSVNSFLSSALINRTSGTGTAGDLTITTSQLVIENGAQVSASTLAAGQGGTLRVNAIGGSVLVTGVSDVVSSRNSGLFSQSFTAGTTRATGNAGSIFINTDRLTVSNGAEISVKSDTTGVAAGELNITAPSILLNRGTLRADTLGSQGNIILQTEDLRLRNRSQIQANALGSAQGGNIRISTATLVALENSDITANAARGPGGRVSIRAEGIFGTAFRSALTAISDITATSDLGPEFSGQVFLQTPDIDPSQGILQVDPTLVDPSGLISQGCGATTAKTAGEFIVTGRGGLPPSPNDTLEGESLLFDLGAAVVRPPQAGSESQPDRPLSSLSITPPETLRQAQGWMVNAGGKVVLLAQAATATPQNPWLAAVSCHAR